MKRPEMILFDYGHTLLYEPDYDFLRGECAVFEHVVRNPRRVTPEEVCDFGNVLFERARGCRDAGLEMHEWPLLRLKYEVFGLEFDRSLPEIEVILWNAVSPGGRMPHVAEMLDDLARRGIRSGVISNIGWSGAALAERIHRLLPGNRFEFILASSDYGVRKPDPLLFQVALTKAGLAAEDVWYCGDSVANDVMGAHAAGIFPVLYQDGTVEKSPWVGRDDGLVVDFDHLRIGDWRELVDILEEIGGAD